MNVQELIDYLETLEPDLPVVVIDGGQCWVIEEKDITKSFVFYHQVVTVKGTEKLEVKNNHAIVLGG